MPYALNLYILTHYLLGAWFMYSLTRQWGFSRSGACLSAASFTLGGYLVSMANVLNNLQAAVWAPAIFICLEKSRGRAPIFWYLIAAIVFAIQFLAGEPQLLILTAVTAFCYHTWRNRSTRWSRRLGNTGAVFAFMGLVACGLTAVQLASTGELIAHSMRLPGFNFEEVTTFSFPPRSFLRLLAPPLFDLHNLHGTTDWIISPYMGIVPVFFSLFSLWFLNDKRIRFWTATLCIGLLLAFGKYTPLYGLLYKTVPFFESFRFPEKFLFLTATAVSLLAGFGFDAYRDKALSQGKQRGAIFTIFALFLLASMVGKWGNREGTGRIAISPVYLGVIALLPLALFLYSKRYLSKISLSICVLLLGGTDLIIAHTALNPVVPYTFYTKRPDILTSMGGISPGTRIFADQAAIKAALPRGLSPFARQALWKSHLLPATGTPYGLAYIDGLGGAETQNQWLLIELLHKLAPEPRKRLLQLASVQYVITRPHDGERHDSGDTSGTDLEPVAYHMPGALPLAYMVPRIQIARDRAEALEKVLEKSFDLTESVIVEKSENLAIVKGEGGIVRRIHFLDPNRIRLRVDSKGGYLVLTDTFYPGWKAIVNGREKKIFRTNGLFKGLFLPPGKHDVLFTFCPSSFSWALGISGMMIVIVLVSLFYYRPGRTGRRGHNVPFGPFQNHEN